MAFKSSVRLGVLALAIVLLSAVAFAEVHFGISVNFGPPAIPVYVQPPCPAPGYIWVPGYWAWDPNFGDYYWVPGTWVLPPQPGYLWTPGYWAWNNGGYVFNQGYWGPQVGFYGGINYGFGYFGVGYVGGRWDHDRFYYNRAVNNVNVNNIHDVYNNTTVINNVNVNRVSYNGGPGGISARPTAQQEAFAHERHVPPVAVQTQHIEQARSNEQLRASVNQGKPPIAATDRPASFHGNGVVAAREAGAPYHPPANRAAAQPNRNEPAPRPENAQRQEPAPRQQVPAPPQNARRQEAAPHPGNAPTPEAAQRAQSAEQPAPIHARDLPPHQPQSVPSTGNPRQDQQYQREQQQLSSQQQKQHQQLQQQQQREHQQLQQQEQRQRPQSANQQANEARMQQMEQQHQQQTQQMEARHAQQQLQMQQRQAPSVAQHNAPRQPEPKHQ